MEEVGYRSPIFVPEKISYILTYSLSCSRASLYYIWATLPMDDVNSVLQAGEFEGIWAERNKIIVTHSEQGLGGTIALKDLFKFLPVANFWEATSNKHLQ